MGGSAARGVSSGPVPPVRQKGPVAGGLARPGSIVRPARPPSPHYRFRSLPMSLSRECSRVIDAGLEVYRPASLDRTCAARSTGRVRSRSSPRRASAAALPKSRTRPLASDTPRQCRKPAQPSDGRFPVPSLYSTWRRRGSDRDVRIRPGAMRLLRAPVAHAPPPSPLHTARARRRA